VASETPILTAREPGSWTDVGVRTAQRSGFQLQQRVADRPPPEGWMKEILFLLSFFSKPLLRSKNKAHNKYQCCRFSAGLEAKKSTGAASSLLMQSLIPWIFLVLIWFDYADAFFYPIASPPTRSHMSSNNDPASPRKPIRHFNYSSCWSPGITRDSNWSGALHPICLEDGNGGRKVGLTIQSKRLLVTPIQTWGFMSIQTMVASFVPFLVNLAETLCFLWRVLPTTTLF